MRRLRLIPEAEFDLEEAHSWYVEQGRERGGQFLRAFGACATEIQRHPEAYALVDRAMRRALLRRFPYAVFFEATRTEVVVYAVFHCARDPRSWRRRRDA